MYEKLSLIRTESGEFALLINEYTRRVSILSVPNKPIPYVHHVMKAVLENKRIKRMMKDYRRKNPYKIQVRRGMSGCIDVKLVVAEPIKVTYDLVDTRYKVRVASRIHISMNDKFNEDIHNIFVADLIDIYNYLCDLEMVETPRGTYKYIKPYTVDDLQNKGFIIPNATNWQ